MCVPVRHSQSADPSQKLREKQGVVFPQSFQKEPNYESPWGPWVPDAGTLVPSQLCELPRPTKSLLFLKLFLPSSFLFQVGEAIMIMDIKCISQYLAGKEPSLNGGCHY